MIRTQWPGFNDHWVSQKLGLDPQLIGSMSSSCINLLFIVVMGYVCTLPLHFAIFLALCHCK